MLKWRDLKIKHKIMSTIVAIVLVSMAATFLIVSGIIRTRLEELLQVQLEGDGNYVTQLFEEYKIKSLNYVRLFTYDTTLQEATYHAASLKWRDPLIKELQGRFKALDLDTLEVCSITGEVLLRSTATNKFGDKKGDLPLFKSAVAGKITVDINDDKDGMYAIRASGRIDHGDSHEPIGVVMTGIYFDDKFAEEMKVLSGAEISIVIGNRVIATTIPSLKDTMIGDDIAAALDEKENVYKAVTLGEHPYGLLYSPLNSVQGKKVGALIVGLPRSDLIAAHRQAAGALFLVVLISCVFSILAGLGVAQGIVRPLLTLTATAETMASCAGDLTQRVEVHSKDEIGILGTAFNRIIATLHDMFLKIRVTADRVAASSEQLSSSTQEVNASTEEISTTIQRIAKGVTTQAKRIEETSRLMEEMSNSVKQVAENSKAASKISEESLHLAQNGGDATEQAVEKMNKITETVTGAAKVVRALGEKSQQIGQITETITSIADQTNLLALNAAIEAARAGEAGRGFAVVAEEVRKLAEGSAEAARRIGALIKSIQIETPKAVSSMEAGTKEVNEGAHIVSRVSDALAQILEAAKQSANMVNEITVATVQQLANSEQIIKAVDEVAAVAQDSASATQETSSSAQEQTASMEEMASNAQDLARMATELKDMVSRFKFNEGVSETRSKM
ncbi:MAG: methyl-accepting chemotaxis protein [Candidatus Omnitrophica bacterium]|nr:methyl-accepting chemotaxis protein [Candidatus Omnitrophota bacterium]MBU4479510.1 methyl-accepting chemotaxis protein [Candidatus Omnitrophota bacterium]MCG2702981.1 methyl-accepting chemotaxis protein [Candidatus Omnitrophota bacterium]